MFTQALFDELDKLAAVGVPKLLKTTASPFGKRSRGTISNLVRKGKKGFKLPLLKTAEETVESLFGGKGDGKDDDDFDRKELSKGKKVEREHTKSKKKAGEIARDHLTEDKKYYSKLHKAGLADELKAKPI
jgi:hypothetical protein